MAIFDLSLELLLCIAFSLERVDQLNLSLTCKRLKDAVEPELYREYSTTSRRILPLVKKLIDRPELRKHVQKLQLGYWGTLEDLGPPFLGINFDAELPPGPTQADYASLAEAARDQNIITEIFHTNATATSSK
jgi:hypothetical protein